MRKFLFILLVSCVSLSASEADLELISTAKAVLNQHYVLEKHFVVAALKTKSGNVYTGINLKTTATRASVCAESIALAKAIEAKDLEIETIVVVAYLQYQNQPVIVTPCGICRELLFDYAPYAKVIISDAPSKVPVRELLTHPYKR